MIPSNRFMRRPNPTGDDEDKEEEEEEEEVRTLVVRAIDGEWVMGEDLILRVTGDETIVEIQQVTAVCLHILETGFEVIIFLSRS